MLCILSLGFSLNPYAPAKWPTRQLDFLESEKSSQIRRCKSSVTKRLDSTDEPSEAIRREGIMERPLGSDIEFSRLGFVHPTRRKRKS